MARKTAAAREGAPTTEGPTTTGTIPYEETQLEGGSVRVALVPIPLEAIAPSRTNPRRERITAESVEDLAASIRSAGVLQPVLVRRKAGGFELVFGHRRLAAAKLAGLSEIPARIAELDDQAVLELQLEENLRRSDLHPMDEAEGYERLLKDHGQTADSIAARVGKSKSHVYGRLKLAALCKRARAAFLEGSIDATHALAIARIPSDKLQEEALRETAGLSFREAQRVILAQYTLALRDAPFATDDAELHPAAGACSACPKRTGNQPELFGDVRSADVCTDPACFREKTARAFKAQAGALPADQVLAPAKARKLFHGGRLTHGSDFVDVDAPDALHALGVWSSSSSKSLRSLLRGKLPEAKLAADDQGRGHWLVPLEAARAAAKAAGVGGKELRREERREGSHRAQERTRRKRAKARTALGEAAVAACLEKLAKLEVPAKFLEVVAAFVLTRGLSDTERAVLKRRGEVMPAGNQGYVGTRERARRWLRSLPERERREAERLFVLEVMLQTGVTTGSWSSQTMGEPLVTACKVLGVKPRAPKPEKGEKKKGAK